MSTSNEISDDLGTLENQLSREASEHHIPDSLKHIDTVSDIETDPKWQTTKKELWSYYLYTIGNTGLPGTYYGPSQFQNLLYLAGYDRSQPPYSVPCDGSVVCVLPFMGKIRDINSIVLITNGIACAIQGALFLIIGAWADYGSWRPNITIAFTAVGVVVSFAWLGVANPSKWEAGVALYLLGLISIQGSLTFWTAAFPGLARSLPEMQASKRALDAGETTLVEHNTLDSLSRNRIYNVATALTSAVGVIVMVVMAGALQGLHSDSSSEANTKAFSVLIAASGGFWLICSIPWFLFERRRPGTKLPPGTSLLTIGVLQTWVALRECWKLKQTFLYLLFYLLMGDVINTGVTIVATLQNGLASYSTIQLTYLLVVNIGTQALGTYACWLVQKRFVFSTKTMLLFNSVWVLVLCGWGLIGIWTTRFGFRNIWEIWAYQAFYGILACPWYTYSQVMISEVIPRGKEFLFFAMFSVTGRTSSLIGPFVAGVIIDDSGNNNMPFAFLLGLGAFSYILLLLVNVDKSRLECAEYLAAEARLEGLDPETHEALG